MPDKPKVMVFGSESLGRGDEQLGKLLMANFLRLLGEEDRRPECICLLNSGVRLALQGGLCLDHMKKLASMGTEILCCGTCLEYFDVEDKLAVGKVSNMHTIQGKILSGGAVVM